MERDQFERLRDLKDKRITTDIRFVQRQQTSPAFVVSDIRIENDEGVDLRMNLRFNPEVGSKTINVYSPGTGPICRVDVDGQMHRPAGRSHKHSLQTSRCPDRNLPDSVVDRSDLEGMTLREVFEIFCDEAAITHEGELQAPDEEN